MDVNIKKATRQSYGEALLDLGRKNKDIVVLDADLSNATKTSIFAKEFPERFFDMGIAEQNMISTAARNGYMWENTFCKYICNVCMSEELMIKLEIAFVIQN